MDRPHAVPVALAGKAPDANLARQPPHIDVDASQGTATQLANLTEGDAEGLSLPHVSQPADAADDDPEPPTTSPPSAGGQHESRLAAVIADIALEEQNPCRAMDVTVFLDSERWGAACVRRATIPPPSPAPTPLRVTASPPTWHSMPRGRASCSSSSTSSRGVPSISLSSWEGDAIPAPHLPGLGITVYYVPPGLVAPGHCVCVCLVCPTPAPSGTPRQPGLNASVPVPSACPVWQPPPPPRCTFASNRGTGIRRWMRPG